MIIMKGRRVFGGISNITQPGDYFGPTQTINAQDEPIGRGVWFLLPIADPVDPFWFGEYNPEASPEEKRQRYLAHRHNGLHRVEEPPWVFRECADGSLEIRESIACGRADPEGEYFHGYLDEGNNWRQA